MLGKNGGADSANSEQKWGKELVDQVLSVLSGFIPKGVNLQLDSSLQSFHFSSIKVLELWLAIKDRFGAELEMSQLHQVSKVSDLCRLIGNTDALPITTVSTNSSYDCTSGHLPLTEIQQSYWVASQDETDPEAVGCILYQEFTIPDIDTDRLMQAWEALVASEGALRLAVTDSGELEIAPQVTSPELIIFTEPKLSGPEWELHLSRVRNQFIERFPSQNSRYRLGVTHSENRESVVHFSLDGKLTDGLGMAKILNLWSSYYQELPTNICANDEQLIVALNCVRSKRQAQSGSATRAYWDDVVKSIPHGVNALIAQQDHTNQADEQVVARQTLSARLDQNTWQNLRVVAEQNSVSPTVLVLTAFSEVFYQRIHQQPFSLLLTTNHRPWISSGETDLNQGMQNVVGPFTGSLVFQVDDLDEDFKQNSTRLQKQLWQDLAHSALDGVEVIRRARRQAASSNASTPVVFTSMLDTGHEQFVSGNFHQNTRYQVSRTTGVYLEHEMSEHQNGLDIRWDIARQYFSIGDVESLFARFIQTLTALTLDKKLSDSPDLNDLQQGYLIKRLDASVKSPEACQIYQCFHVDQLDVPRLEVAVARWVNDNKALRTYIDISGRKQTCDPEIKHWRLPMVDLRCLPDQAGALSALKQRSLTQPFALGCWPMFEVLVSQQSDEQFFIHVTIDLALVDAVSIRMLARQLFDYYRNENFSLIQRLSEVDWLQGQQVVSKSPVTQDWSRYWNTYLSDLPSGPGFVTHSDQNKNRQHIRLEGQVANWQKCLEQAKNLDISADALLSSAFAFVLAKRSMHHPFAFPVVCWESEANKFRPGEYTALTWLQCEPVELFGESCSLINLAQGYQQVLNQRPPASAVSGLSVLRKLQMSQQQSQGFSVVYTSIFKESQLALAEGIREVSWLTSTPDVSLDMISVERENGLYFYWDAVEEDFSAGEIRSCFGDLQRLLDTLSVTKDWTSMDLKKILDINEEPAYGAHRPAGMVPEKFKRIVNDWNNTKTEYDDSHPAYLLIEQQSKKQPDEIALVSSKQELTFSELNGWANKIAWTLKENAVGPETIVAVSMAPTPLMIATVLGIHKAGGAYLPLAPELPETRKRSILEESGASLWVIDDTPQPEGICSLIEIENVVPENCKQIENPPPVVSTSNTAYLIYTSGSTGKPKGVMVAHHSLLNLIDWAKREFNFNSNDMGLMVASLGFDLSVFDIFGVLGCGGALYIASYEERQNPDQLFQVLVDQPVTFWNSSPAALFQLKEKLSESSIAPDDQSLRLVFLSGDFTPLSLPDEVRKTFSNAQIINLGGATEATVWSNYYKVGDVSSEWRSIPYGVPISNSRYYIFNEQLETCDVGEEGDLYIAGDCVTVGYWQQSGLTARSFIPNPFGLKPGERMYRTGDRAAYLADGNITFIGRSDGQVKIRGYRVELGEIEHRLRLHPAIQEAVVLVREDYNNDKKLVAYVIAKDGAAGGSSDNPGVKDLRSFVADSLPQYMVPNFVAFIDTLPCTSNGKIDRKALPWPVNKPVASNSSPKETIDTESLEQVNQFIHQLVCQQLGVEQVDDVTDLWDLGITSFNMIQISNGIQKKYKCGITVSALVNDPTVRGIQKHVGAQLGVGNKTLAQSRSVKEQQGPSAENQCVEPGQLPNGDNEVFDLSPGYIDLFDEAAVEAFKKSGINKPVLAGKETAVSLSDERTGSVWHQWRSNHRTFEQRTILKKDLEKLLSVLAAGKSGYLYPSAGGTYAIQSYLHLQANAVAGLEQGWYYYDDEKHALVAVNRSGKVKRTDHFFYNREIYDSASFSLVMVGQRRAIEPLYGEAAERYLLLEAGYMGQLLMLAQASCNIGMCIIGSMNLDSLKDVLQLNDGHIYLQSFLGGYKTPAISDTDPTVTRQLPFLVSEQSAEKLPLQSIASHHESLSSQGVLGQDIAIVGLAGRYPQADTLEQFWNHLEQGRQSFSHLNRNELLGESNNHLYGGFLDNISHFDSLLFHISPREAAQLDPQTRLLLQTVWECLESSNHTPESLNADGKKVGVFVAVMWHDYQVKGGVEQTPVSGMGSDIANRISYCFQFTGPSLAVNTSCSSSLTALHLARQSINQGECDSAIVCAVNLFAHDYHGRVLKEMNLLSSHATQINSPTTATLEQHPGAAYSSYSDGWIPGEGCGAVLLRSETAAVNDADSVLAWLKATHVSHVGAPGRYSAPDAEKLTESIKAMMQNAYYSADDIAYVECAATGAGMPDLAELEALNSVLANAKTKPWVGCIKPNIGHLEAAAGMSQLTKVILQLTHQQLLPTVAAAPDQRTLDWQNLPMRLCTKGQSIVPQVNNGTGKSTAKLSLVNAMGATGSYAHALIAPAAKPAVGLTKGSKAGPYLVPVSGLDEDALKRVAIKLREFLQAQTQQPDLASISYSLQVGRQQLPQRALVICYQVQDLIESLDCLSRNTTHHCLYSDAEQLSTYDKLAHSWLLGHKVPWKTLWSETPTPCVLPTYPFANDHYWLATTESDAMNSTVQSKLPTEPASRQQYNNQPDPELVTWLCQMYGRISGMKPGTVKAGVPLEHYGLSSALVAEMNAEIKERFPGTSSSLFYQYPTLADIAGHLSSENQNNNTGSQQRDEQKVEVNAGSKVNVEAGLLNEDIAIIGMSGIYPGADSLEQFWENLVSEKDCIRPIPEQRKEESWSQEAMNLPMWGGFLDRVDQFDSQFFGITPRDASYIDPQARMFMQVVWNALQSAGYGPTRFRQQHHSNCAVYVGSMYSEYSYFGVEESLLGNRQSSDTANADIANRVSYFLDLHGPSMTVDTMCSSSLTCLHLAVQALQRGEVEVAIAGGVNLCLHPNKYITLERLKMASSDHRCKSFSADGDGFIPGEGAGAVLLKPLVKAEADGDRILAVIKGTALNHGGRSNGYMVPNVNAQAELVTKALNNARLSSNQIHYIEAHGTGTSLGDPVEINGLAQAFENRGGDKKVPIGSVKSSIGHLEAAAGIAGLTKVVLQLQKKQLVASIHAQKLNPNIDWQNSCFNVQREFSDWQSLDGAPLAAGISSFGAGGANGHVIVQEYQGAGRQYDNAVEQYWLDHQMVWLPLSAQDPTAMRTQLLNLQNILTQQTEINSHTGRDSSVALRRVLGQLKSETARDSLSEAECKLLDKMISSVSGKLTPEQHYLYRLGYTLQIGREGLKYRVCLTGGTIQQVLDQIKLLLEQVDVGGKIDTTKITDAEISPTGSDGSMGTIASRWCQGNRVKWSALYGETKPEILTLPDYPFTVSRCWIPSAKGTSKTALPLTASPTRTENQTATLPGYQKQWTQESQVNLAAASNNLSTGANSITVCVYQSDSAVLVTQLQQQMPGYQWQFLDIESPNTKERLKQLLAADNPVALYLDMVDLAGKEEHRENLSDRINCLQNMLASSHSGAQVIHVSEKLRAVGGASESISGAAMAAVFLSVASEYKSFSVRTVDLETRDQLAPSLAYEFSRHTGDREVCYRNHSRFVPSLAVQPLAFQQPFVPKADSTYVFTGGTRGIGAMLAKEWVKRGARKIVLLNSSGWVEPDSKAAQQLSHQKTPAQQVAVDNVMALRSMGAQVEVASGLLENAQNLAAYLNQVSTQIGPIDGVFHCAGTGSHGRPAFIHKNYTDIQQSLRPKVQSLEILADALNVHRPRFCLLFSSVSSLLPQLSTGVVDYAAANAFMDMFAIHQHCQGRKEFIAINWPFWARTQDEVSAKACENAGLEPITDAQGIQFIDALLGSHRTSSLAYLPILSHRSGDLDVVSLQVKRNVTVGARAPSTSQAVASPLQGGIQKETERQTINHMSPQKEGVPGWLIELFAGLLHLDKKDIDLGLPFADMGVESVMLAELVTAIEQELDTYVEPSLLLDYPTLTKLSAALPQQEGFSSAVPDIVPPVAEQEVKIDKELSSYSMAEPAVNNPAPVNSPLRPSHQDVAVIGMSGSYPDSENLKEFWQLLESAQCAVKEVPKSRWDTDLLYDAAGCEGKSVSKWGGFLKGLEQFDPAYFGMSEKEAIETDPAIRLMLEQAVNCLCDAGYRRDELWGQDIGVYVGSRISGYRKRIAGQLGAAGLGGDQNFIAARVAHYLNWHGTNIVVDSACSSALSALEMACHSIRLGSSEMAMVGGVDVLIDEDPYLEFTEAKALSKKGLCQTFDKNADGFVPGEGCGVVLLKSLEAAMRDGDQIHGVIKGIASNNDGRTMGLTTPNPEAQSQVIRKALKDAQLEAGDVSLIEAHGTGTKIGDPIELKALNQVFGEQTKATQFCAISSVKTNIGHLLSAAGMASLSKVLLAMKHKKIPSTLHCHEANPRFDFANSPFYPSLETRSWQSISGRRVAGISAFGLGGSNVHVLVSDDENILNGYQPTRFPLPQPVFNKQRCWLEAKNTPLIPTQKKELEQGVKAGSGKKRVLPLSFNDAPVKQPSARRATLSKLTFTDN